MTGVSAGGEKAGRWVGRGSAGAETKPSSSSEPPKDDGQRQYVSDVGLDPKRSQLLGICHLGFI